jgi:hypothetical protein
MKKILKYAPVVLLAGLLSGQRANANSMGLIASDTTGSSTGTASGTTDIISGPGTITDWATITATGNYTFPPGNETLSTLDVTSTGAGTLYILYSVAGISTPNKTLDLSLTSLGISGGMTVQDKVYVDTGNGGNNIDDTLASLAGAAQVNGTLSLGGLSVLSGSGPAPGTPYSLTEEFIITATGANETAAFQAGADSVPDGGTTMIMLGGAFCAIGAIRRKISQK